MSGYEPMISGLLVVARDVAPVFIVALFFQYAVLRVHLPNPHRIAGGALTLVIGLYLFLLGLEIGIFPIGEAMAKKFSLPEHRNWTLLFAFCIGYSTTMAEPALIAVTQKAEEVSSGGLKSLRLRNAVALGVAIGLAVGVHRIFSGDPLWVYIMAGYAVALTLTWFAPKEIVPLAYDSGGVTTSTITVPLVTALGLGLASNTPGRDPLTDGFGLIAFASVFPMITVLSYAIIMQSIVSFRKRR